MKIVNVSAFQSESPIIPDSVSALVQQIDFKRESGGIAPAFSIISLKSQVPRVVDAVKRTGNAGDGFVRIAGIDSIHSEFSIA